MGTNVGYTENGVDIGAGLVDRSYLIDRYPELVDTFKQAGLWLWGQNVNSALGDNTGTSRSSPVQTISGGTNWRSVAAGGYHTAAIKTDGTLWTWGYNGDGELGNNSIADRSSPVQTVSGGTNWKSVVAGNSHTAAIKTGGTLWTWGYNGEGELGDNSATNRSSPVQTVSGGTNWKLVACGGGHTTAIKTDGTLWLWGYNFYGQLGDNTITSRSSPVQITGGGTNWRTVAGCGNWTAAIKTNGTLWTWGANTFGQLGHPEALYRRSSPVQITAGGADWKLVACGSQHSAAIKTDGTLWTWGYNGYGQLGDGTTTIRYSPVQTVSVGTNWKSVAAGTWHTVAVKTDGTLWTWGIATNGVLGDNTSTHKSSPIQTVSGGTNWKSVAAGDAYTAAIRDDSSDIFGNYI